MAKLTITIPDSVDDIPVVLKDLKAQLAAVNAQRQALVAAIKAVQSTCKHPNMTYSRDISGCGEGYCHICEYSY